MEVVAADTLNEDVPPDIEAIIDEAARLYDAGVCAETPANLCTAPNYWEIADGLVKTRNAFCDTCDELAILSLVLQSYRREASLFDAARLAAQELAAGPESARQLPKGSPEADGPTPTSNVEDTGTLSLSGESNGVAITIKGAYAASNDTMRFLASVRNNKEKNLVMYGGGEFDVMTSAAEYNCYASGPDELRPGGEADFEVECYDMSANEPVTQLEFFDFSTSLSEGDVRITIPLPNLVLSELPAPAE